MWDRAVVTVEPTSHYSAFLRVLLTNEHHTLGVAQSKYGYDCLFRYYFFLNVA